MNKWIKIRNQRDNDFSFCTIHSTNSSLSIPIKYFPKESKSADVYFSEDGKSFAIKPCEENKGCFKLTKSSSNKYHISCGTLKNRIKVIPGRYEVNWDGEMCIIFLKDRM